MSARLFQHLETIWNYQLMGHQLEAADCLFVLCSNDLRVAEYAAQLYKQGLAPYVMVSGGKGRFTEDFDQSEAETFADVLMDEGVPASALLLETEATNTGENMTLSHAVMIQKGLHFSRFILVQKPFMERRAYATFLKQWPGEKESVICTSPPIDFIDYPNDSLPFDHVVEATLADFERVRDYPALGYQIPQAIPEHVLEAYSELKKQGL
ncbi:YdcF family protein [Enterovibrio paralichthyis]|uniref:YdcF family protein n=1 Tax=Enterovibrio paralichthyis TaxID=2853805 RepID=UPI001C479434|nr:YdcF family protein [Enterovibrio paralichthyis]MBV7296345.1 YdcF family protein [Enterovibrio paralichthyis]